MQIMMTVDADQKMELEAMIKDLEEENRALQSEYDHLKQVHEEQLEHPEYSDDITEDLMDGVKQNQGDSEVMAEARLLRQHKGRLEARMRILEEHNEHLDSQLRRLRQLLNSAEQPTPGSSVDGHILTYPQTATPSELSNASSHSSLPRRGPPPSFSSAANSRNFNVDVDNRRLHCVADGLHMSSSPEEETVGVFHETSPVEQSRGTNSSNISDLLQVASEVGKAVESLVTIMTDDEQ
jgi:dystrophin